METFRNKMRRVDAVDPLRPAWSGDTRRLRELHAERYLYVLRPLILLSLCALVVVTALVAPGEIGTPAYAVTSVSIAVTVAAVLARGRADPVRVAYLTSLADLGLVLVYVLASSEPAPTAIVTCWQLVVLAYFGTPRIAVAAGGGAAIVLWIGSTVLDSWVERGVVPAAAFGVFIMSLLVAFMVAQAQRVEGALAAALARDRVAFLLARRIRMADDPRHAIAEIAEAVGEATDSACALVALLEQDDYLTDMATWRRGDPSDARAWHHDVTIVDSTLLHLVATGHGAVLERGVVSVLVPEGKSEATPPGGSAVDASMRALVRYLDAGSGLVTPLPMAGRTVGAIILAGAEDHDWTATAVPLLEPLAPQLAAGLAQVVLVRDQREALESIERLDRMRDRLIANVSHELRTPLTSTMGFVETALRDDIQLDETTRQELLVHARDGGLRLLSLVEDLLALGSTRPESLDLSPEPVDVGRLVADSLRGIEGQPGRELRVQVEHGTRATVDRNRIMQVVANLVVNALHHGCGDVLVEARLRRGQVVIDVTDDGHGVAPEHVQELFLPFSRFSTRPDSTGLGLAICRTIVEAHSGTITYARVDGRTRFRVQLPILPPNS